MRLTDAFERVYILNLPFKTDRRERLAGHLRDLDLVDESKVSWNTAICGDWAPPPAWWGSGNGAWGCLMSHARTLQDAIHAGLESFLVLEDDVVFHPEARQMLADFMAAVPSDWGQIYLGGQFLHKDPDAVGPGVVRPYNVNRTHAYAVSKKWMAKVCQHILHFPDYLKPQWDGGNLQTKLVSNKMHVDHQLGRAHERKDWPTYAPEWWLAGQEAGSSNISGKTNSRQWWFWWGLWDRVPVVIVPPGITLDQLPPDLLHFGNTPVNNTLTDQGLIQAAQGRPEDQFAFIKLIAQEALKSGHLPALQIPAGIHFDPTVWTPGVVDWQQAETYRYA